MHSNYNHQIKHGMDLEASFTQASRVADFECSDLERTTPPLPTVPSKPHVSSLWPTIRRLYYM